MKIDVHWIQTIAPGRLGIMSRPRGGDWLSEEILAWRDDGIDIVLSLLQETEAKELDLLHESILCAEHGIAYLSYPIADRGTPVSRRETLRLVQRLGESLSQSKSILIHCRHGIGRSALIAACVLVIREVSVESAFESISKARGCAVPDTEEQRDWVRSFAFSLRHVKQ